MAASIEEVGAMTESLSAAVEQNSDVDRADVAVGAVRSADERAGAITDVVTRRRRASTQMERSIEASVARPAGATS